MGPILDKFEIEETGTHLTISWRWQNIRHFLMFFFSVLWNTSLLGFYATILGGGEQAQGLPWVVLLFPLGHVAVGIGLFYSSVAGFVNRTWITVADQQLTVRHGPLPWLGSRTLSVTEIKQLYCVERRRRNKAGFYFIRELNVLDTSGRQVRLVRGRHDPGAIRFLEQKIEKRLGIVNKPVEGEMVA